MPHIQQSFGVCFEIYLSFGDHIYSICKTCFVQICDLGNGGMCVVRQYLTDKAAILVAYALVGIRLDYCHSLFGGLTNYNNCKLLCFGKKLSMIATKYNRYAWVTFILHRHHWLPVKYYYIFKVGTLVYKYLHSFTAILVFFVYPHGWIQHKI